MQLVLDIFISPTAGAIHLKQTPSTVTKMCQTIKIYSLIFFPAPTASLVLLLKIHLLFFPNTNSVSILIRTIVLKFNLLFKFTNMPAALTALAKASWRRHRILSYPAADRFAGRLGRTLFISMLVVLSNVKMLTKSILVIYFI